MARSQAMSIFPRTHFLQAPASRTDSVSPQPGELCFPSPVEHAVTRHSLSLCTGAPGGIVAAHGAHAAVCPGRLQQHCHGHRLRGTLPRGPAAGSHHEADADGAESAAPCDGAAEAAVSPRAEAAAAAAADLSRAGTVSICLQRRLG